jgi:hypothetical protein
VVRSMFEINIGACYLLRSWVQFLVRPILLRSWVQFLVRPIPHVIESATLSNSVDFLQGLLIRTLQITNIVYLANNVLVDGQLSIQYLKKIIHSVNLANYIK